MLSQYDSTKDLNSDLPTANRISNNNTIAPFMREKDMQKKVVKPTKIFGMSDNKYMFLSNHFLKNKVLFLTVPKKF